MQKPRALFIPADCIELNYSRSYYLGKYLAQHYDLYWLRYYDSRSANPALAPWRRSVGAMLHNLSTRLHIRPQDGWRHVHLPFLSPALLRKVVGDQWARRISRAFNGRMLKRVVQRVQPQVLIYADGFYHYPLVAYPGARVVADIQDDFDTATMPAALRRYEQGYGQRCFGGCAQRYTISEAAASHLGHFFGLPFGVLPNGAEFASLRQVPVEAVQQIRQRWKIPPHHRVVTYIGTAAKFSPPFVQQLLDEVSRRGLPWHFVLVGDLPAIDSPLVSQVGPLTSAQTYPYYRLSDVGLIPIFHTEDPFILNSAPLKAIQYAAARCPLVSYPMPWAEKGGYRSIYPAKGGVSAWIDQLEVAMQHHWTEADDAQWANFDWAHIVATLVQPTQA